MISSTVLQSTQVKRTPPIHWWILFIIRKLHPLVAVRIPIQLCIPVWVTNSEFARDVHVVVKLPLAQFCFRRNFVHSNILADRIQRGYRKKLTAHYACRNADLNLIVAAATTKAGIQLSNKKISHGILGGGWGKLDLVWLYTVSHRFKLLVWNRTADCK